MRFFNIDLHVAVIHDVRTILSELGHEVTSHNLSGHMWTIGAPQSSGFGPVTTASWEALLWRRDVHALLPSFASDLGREFDGFIVCYPPAFSQLYVRYEKSIIMVVPIRYETPYTRDADRWRSYNEVLVSEAMKGRLHVLANNAYDAKYYEYFTGSECSNITSLCSYATSLANRDYRPTDGRAYIFGEDSGARECESRVPGTVWVRNLGSVYRHSDLTRPRAHVHIPYNASVMSFFEHYWLNVPQFVPTRRFLAELASRGAALSQISWSPERSGSVLPRAGTSLSDPNHRESLGEWMPLYDFYALPHVVYFDSWLELWQKLISTDLDAISRQMSAENHARKSRTLDAWRAVLGRIAA